MNILGVVLSIAGLAGIMLQTETTPIRWFLASWACALAGLGITAYAGLP